MQIGNIHLEKSAALAPMAGVADRAFREICAEMGAAFVVGEMASARGLAHRSKKSAELLMVTQTERPMAVQLFGDEPDTMARAAEMAAQHRPDWLDINMGCPAPKIAGGGAGAALLKDLALAGRIIRAVVNAVDIPVTVKIRKGWDAERTVAVEAALIAEEEGAAAVTVHGRTRQQMYSPPVDLDIIAQVKRAVRIPVIGNGDVDSVDAAVHMYRQTGCDLVMAGRGALGNPWLFRQIKAHFAGEAVPAPPTAQERMAVLLEQIRRACLYKGEYAALREARSHAAWYLKGMRGAAHWRRVAGGLSTYADLEALAAAVLAGAPEDAPG